MTQAMSLSEILKREGHVVEKVLLGRSETRTIPSFFLEAFDEKPEYFKSPNFSFTKDKKGILVGKSLLLNLLISPRYIKEIIRMSRKIHQSKADVVVNFYDMIGGLGMLFSFSRKKYYAISHHFYYSQKDFNWPESRPLIRYLLKLHSFICSYGADAKLVLSFRENGIMLKKGYMLVPPLLRDDLFRLIPEDKGYLLGYMLNEGLLWNIIDWSLKNPGIKVVLYGSFKSVPPNIPENLTINQLDGQGFLNSMAGCSGLISTAGFESVCEAAYLGKRIWLIPSRNHFEQECNALDASASGLAGYFLEFQSEYFVSDQHKEAVKNFRNWCNKADKIFVNILCTG